MTLEDLFRKVSSFIRGRYGSDLVCILVFGSANTGEFREGESDIDLIVIIKEMGGMNGKEEKKFLSKALEDINVNVSYFWSLEELEKKAKEGMSFSSYITLASPQGSREIYVGPYFENVRRIIEQNPPSLETIKKYIREKDKFELEGYIKEAKGYLATKHLFFHLRRKLQILFYLNTGRLKFDFVECAQRMENEEEKIMLINIHSKYVKREQIESELIKRYFDLAYKLSERICAREE